MNSKLSTRAIKIVTILQKALPIKDRDFISLWVGKKFNGDMYRILVATILSQSANDKASLAAYSELDLKIGVSPENLDKAGVDKIEDCIRSGGLQRMKAKALKGVSREIMKNKNILQSIQKLPLIEARESLQKLPGVGPKTADVVLMTAANMPGLAEGMMMRQTVCQRLAPSAKEPARRYLGKFDMASSAIVKMVGIAAKPRPIAMTMALRWS